MQRSATFLERYFHLSEAGTNVRTEIGAGLTTFMTMAYILAVNPGILSACGMDASAVFTATAISAAIASIIMAFVANLPIGLAPGMGINAFFAYTVVLGMGHSWQFALTAVFIEGLIFIALTLTNFREAILNSIPMPLKQAISAGIGLFIAFIGLQNAGIVVRDDAVLLGLGQLSAPGAIIAIIGTLIIGVLLVRKIKGALLIGMIVTTLLGIPLGATNLSTFEPSHFFNVPSLAPTFLQFELHNIFSIDMLITVFTFLFVDMFDTVGTLVGVATKAKLLDENGHFPKARPAFLADAIGTAVGAVLGTSTVTSFVESSSGVAAGGRTGLTAFTTGILFLLALFIAPIFLLVPPAATAPALIIVGLFMMSPIKDLDYAEYPTSIPAFLILALIPLSYSIATGIAIGIVAYVILSVLTGRARKIPLLTYVLAVLFAIKFAL